MISSLAPTRSLTFHAYLITKIGNGNLKHQLKTNTTFCEITTNLRTYATLTITMENDLLKVMKISARARNVIPR